MRKLFPFAFVTVALLGCQTTQIRPLESAQGVNNISSEESRLWHAAGEFDDALENGEHVYENAVLETYVQGIMDKLYPEYVGAIDVKVSNSPELNAFALPNGSIYINTGMLARLENEAQLATVLAHEGAHFIHKHGWKQQRNVKTSSAFGLGVGMFVGIPALGDVMAASSIYGFSRDLEREADAMGFERLQATGYDVSQAATTFRHLAEEVEALDVKEPYFFASHPKLAERIRSFEELSAAHGGGSGYRGEKKYRSMVSHLRLETLEDYLEMGRYQSVLVMLDKEGALALYPSQAKFYLGEAYRLRNDEQDLPRAEAAYLDAAKSAPRFPDTHRALGVHYMKQGDAQRADYHFAKYLKLAPNAPDRAYIEGYKASLK